MCPLVNLMTPEQQQAIEAAVARKLMGHLQKYPEVQNIDLMNLGYFCRNCLAKWYQSAANAEGVEMDYNQAREIVYGMPYEEYKNHHQQPATEDQQQQLTESQKKATE